MQLPKVRILKQSSLSAQPCKLIINDNDYDNNNNNNNNDDEDNNNDDDNDDNNNNNNYPLM